MITGGIFGKKKYNWGDPEQPGLPPMGSGAGMPQPAAMQEQPKRQGFFQRPSTHEGIATFVDTLAKLRRGIDLGMMDGINQGKQREFAEAQYERKRRDEFTDWQRRQQHEQQNKAPYRWESNDGSLMEMTPNGPRVAYKDPTRKPVMQIDPTTGIMRSVQLEEPVPDAEFGGWDDGDTPPATVGVPAPKLGDNGMPSVLTPAQYQAVVQSLGKEKTDAWVRQYNIRIAQ